MGKDGGSNKTLENSKGAETESRPENREELVKGGHGPTTFGEDEDEDLGDDEQPVNNSPEDPSGLIRNRAIPRVAVRNGRRKCGDDTYSM